MLRLDVSLLPLSLWPTGPGVAGRGGPELLQVLLLSSALAVAQMEALLEILFKTMLLQLALTGPAVDLKNSRPHRHFGCYWQTVSDFHHS